MTARSQPVTFVNQQGLRLFGILTEPEVSSGPKVGFILLSPGIKSRVAPHRLYNKIANALVEIGFPVLRFDFYGLGDSEGRLDDVLLADLYGHIQLGRYVDDTCAAVAWMRQERRVDRCVLIGLCGGGITGVLAAAKEPEHIAGIAAFGLPVNLDGSQIDKVSNMTVGQLTSMRGRYVRKFLSLRAWLRFFSLKSDYRLLFRALGVPFAAASHSPTPTSGNPRPTAPVRPKNDLNPFFAPAFLRLLQERMPILLVFSETDRLHWEYREKFWASHRELLDQSDSLETTVVKDANHVFTFSEWQEELMALCRGWLHRRIVDLPADLPLERSTVALEKAEECTHAAKL